MGYFNNNKVLDYMNHPDTVDGKVNPKLGITDIVIDFKGNTDARITVVVHNVIALCDWKVSYGTFNDSLKVTHSDYKNKWNNNGRSGETTLVDFDKDWLTAVECQVMRFMAPQLKKPSELPKTQPQQQAPRQPAQQNNQQNLRNKYTFNAAGFNASKPQANTNPQTEEDEEQGQEISLTPADVVG